MAAQDKRGSTVFVGEDPSVSAPLKIHEKPIEDVIAEFQTNAETGLSAALETLRETHKIPIVLYSSKPEEELREIFVEADADGYIPKSATKEEIIGMLKAYFIVLCG